MSTDLDSGYETSEDSIAEFIDAVENIRIHSTSKETRSPVDAKRRLEILLEERQLRKQLEDDFTWN